MQGKNFGKTGCIRSPRWKECDIIEMPQTQITHKLVSPHMHRWSIFQQQNDTNHNIEKSMKKQNRANDQIELIHDSLDIIRSINKIFSSSSRPDKSKKVTEQNILLERTQVNQQRGMHRISKVKKSVTCLRRKKSVSSSASTNYQTILLDVKCTRRQVTQRGLIERRAV